MTLSNLGTTVHLSCTEFSSQTAPIKLIFSNEGYVPPDIGIQKLQNYFSRFDEWSDLLTSINIEAHFPNAVIEVLTRNSVPAATGIATSASSFAAYTLAYVQLLAGEKQFTQIQSYLKNSEFLSRLALMASRGSGSAARSFMGPWVEWTVDSVNTVPVGQHFGKWVDLICIVEADAKKVSSSEAHQRVCTSPHYEGRADRSQKRLSELKGMMLDPVLFSYERLQKLVWEESEDMHRLFHTSIPALQYQSTASNQIAEFAFSSKAPTSHAVVTQDAGSNIHIFVPISEEKVWNSALNQQFPKIPILVGK
jgi:diphosphomevalonate decarboxylase